MSWQPPPPPMPPPPPPPPQPRPPPPRPPPPQHPHASSYHTQLPPPPPPSSHPPPSRHPPSPHSSSYPPPPLSHPSFSYPQQQQQQRNQYGNNKNSQRNLTNDSRNPSSNNSMPPPPAPPSVVSMNRPPPPSSPYPQKQFQNMSIQSKNLPPPPPSSSSSYPQHSQPPPQYNNSSSTPKRYPQQQQQSQQQQKNLIESRQVPRPIDCFASSSNNHNNKSRDKRMSMMSDVIPRNHVTAERTLNGADHMPLFCTPFATSSYDDIQRIVLQDGDEIPRCSTCDSYDNMYNTNTLGCSLCGGKIISSFHSNSTQQQQQQQEYLTSNHCEYILLPSSQKQQQEQQTDKAGTIQLVFGLIMDENYPDKCRPNLLQFLETLFSTYQNDTSSISFQVGIIFFHKNTMIIPYCRQRQNDDGDLYYWQIVQTTISNTLDDINIPLPLDLFMYSDISILKHILQTDWDLYSFGKTTIYNDIYLAHLIYTVTAASLSAMKNDFNEDKRSTIQNNKYIHRQDNDTVMTHLFLFTHFGSNVSASSKNTNLLKQQQQQQRYLTSLAISHQVCVHILFTNHISNNPIHQSNMCQKIIQSTNGHYLQISSKYDDMEPQLLHLMDSYHGIHINGGSSNIIFKVRCSSGLKIRHGNDVVYHNAGILTSDLMLHDSDTDSIDDFDELDWIDSWRYEDEWQLPCMTNHTCLIINFKHRVGGIKTKHAYFQMATLYTHANTQTKRLRVSTTQFDVSDDVSKVFRSANIHNVASSWIRSAITDNTNNKSHDEEQYQRGVDILSNYRLHTSARKAPLGQLILPECLQLLPLVMYSWNKKQSEKNIQQNKYHDGIGRHFHILIPSFVMLYLYPSLHLFSDLHQMSQQQQQTLASTILPTTIQSIPPSKGINDTASCNDAYLLDIGVALYFYNPGNWNFDQAFFWKYINRLRENRPYYVPFYNLGDDVTQMLPFLVEDSNSNIPTNGVGYEYVAAGGNSYVEYLCQLHQRIRKVIEHALKGVAKFK